MHWTEGGRIQITRNFAKGACRPAPLEEKKSGGRRAFQGKRDPARRVPCRHRTGIGSRKFESSWALRKL